MSRSKYVWFQECDQFFGKKIAKYSWGLNSNHSNSESIRKPNILKVWFWMISNGVRILNGVRFSNGLDKMAALLFGFWMVLFGFWMAFKNWTMSMEQLWTIQNRNQFGLRAPTVHTKQKSLHQSTFKSSKNLNQKTFKYPEYLDQNLTLIKKRVPPKKITIFCSWFGNELSWSRP